VAGGAYLSLCGPYRGGMPVLGTKVHLPPSRRRLVARPRLTDLLGAEPGSMPRLVLVAAPAGFGKTTLVTQWLAAHTVNQGGRAEHQTGPFPPIGVAWLSLDAADSDLARFMSGLVAALQTAAPHVAEEVGRPVGADALTLLDAARGESAEPALISLVNDLDTLVGATVLVLDDYHVVDAPAVHDAVTFIEALRQADDLGSLPIGRRVVVVGGGMTAVDAAVQAKKLGAEEVTMVYRRGPEAMGASRYEQELAQTAGVVIRFWARPLSVEGEAGQLRAVTFAVTADEGGRLVDTGQSFALPADQLFKAVGQVLVPSHFEGGEVLELSSGRIAIDAERRTSLPGVWAGGDCALGGRDLTVVAVEDGKQAALSIDRALRAAMPLAAE